MNTVWCNGAAQAIGAASHLINSSFTDSRAFQYGDGVFRTMLCWQSSIVFEAAQIARVCEDAARLDLQVDRAQLECEVRQLAAISAEPAVLKVVLVRRGRGRGYAPLDNEAERWLIRSPTPSYPDSHWRAGITLGLSPILLGLQPRLAGIKHLNRLEQVLIYQHALPDCDEQLCLDLRQQVICGGRSNLFWLAENDAGRAQLCTPALHMCGIRGVTRDQVIATARELGLGCAIDDFTMAHLQRAQEVFVCNSLIGVWPVRALKSASGDTRVDAQHWPAPGPWTTKLMHHLAHPCCSEKR